MRGCGLTERAAPDICSCFSANTFLAPVGLKAKPQEEAATVAAVSRSEDAADSNMHLYVFDVETLQMHLSDRGLPWGHLLYLFPAIVSGHFDSAYLKNASLIALYDPFCSWKHVFSLS